MSEHCICYRRQFSHQFFSPDKRATQGTRQSQKEGSCFTPIWCAFLESSQEHFVVSSTFLANDFPPVSMDVMSTHALDPSISWKMMWFCHLPLFTDRGLWEHHYHQGEWPGTLRPPVFHTTMWYLQWRDTHWRSCPRSLWPRLCAFFVKGGFRSDSPGRLTISRDCKGNKPTHTVTQLRSWALLQS